MEGWPVHVVVAGAGLLAGCVFGAVAQYTRFCTMGAIGDVVFQGDYRRWRAWVLAIAVAILGTQTLYGAGLIDVYQSLYLTPNLGWLGALMGGLVFGFGMTMSGGCGQRTLVRLGEGNLRSLVAAVVLAIFAYMTLRGVTGLARVQLERATNVDLRRVGLTSQGIVDLLAAVTGVSAPVVRCLVVVSLVGVLLWYCFKDVTFRASRRDIAAGLVVGGLIPTGWVITGWLGSDAFEPVPVASFTFVAPVGESLQYLMTFTGATVNFGIAAVGGVLVGAWTMALLRQEFRLETFADVDDLLRHLGGGALMGMGGVVALGCTIGQGITGMSTLASGSLLAWLGLLAGGFGGMQYRKQGSFTGACKALLVRREPAGKA